MSYIHLTLEERVDIKQLKSSVSLREIGRRVGRSHTSISRELKRNSSADSGVYKPDAAHKKAQLRQSSARHYRRQAHIPLVRFVERRLCFDWPPAAISGRLKVESAPPPL